MLNIPCIKNIYIIHFLLFLCMYACVFIVFAFVMYCIGMFLSCLGMYCIVCTVHEACEPVPLLFTNSPLLWLQGHAFRILGKSEKNCEGMRSVEMKMIGMIHRLDYIARLAKVLCLLAERVQVILDAIACDLHKHIKLNVWIRNPSIIR